MPYKVYETCENKRGNKKKYILDNCQDILVKDYIIL